MSSLRPNPKKKKKFKCVRTKEVKKERMKHTIDINIPFVVPERFEKVKKDTFGFIVLDNKGYIIGAIFSKALLF